MADTRRGPKGKDKSASTPLRGVPEPPAHLGAIAAAHWREVAELIDQAGLLSEVDRFALEIYCQLYEDYRYARDQVVDAGKVITAPNGYRQQNPWYQIATQCQKDMKHYFDKFGLTPGARTKLAIEEPAEVDSKWEQFD
jgi:P27 family predicted phage terminase small subunit